jgi:hypothetical protein
LLFDRETVFIGGQSLALFYLNAVSRTRRDCADAAE